MVLDKRKFLFLLVNNSSLSPDETEALQLLQNEFPYSQAIHNLVARGSQLNDLPAKQMKLNMAAVYATDRAILKAIITTPAEERKLNEKEVVPEPPMEVEKPAKTEAPKAQIAAEQKVEEEMVNQKPDKELPSQPVVPAKKDFVPSKLSGDDLLDELYQDLDRLKKLKHGFEVASFNFDTLPTVPTAPDANTTPHSVAEVKEDPKPAKKPKDANKGIIAEIKSTKKKIKPSDPRQKEQLDIIDKFIKSKPSISKGKTSSPAPPATDLSESSSVFTDNIVSETLVEILIKQGKKEKAIEVLRKLIWKFPQKKAYFAAQIEELTN